MCKDHSSAAVAFQPQCIQSITIKRKYYRMSWSLLISRWNKFKTSLIMIHYYDHSFILDISIAPLQVHYYSEALLTLQHRYCVRVNTPKRYRQLWVKELPRVPTWQLEWASNLRPLGRKAPNLPMSHPTPPWRTYPINSLKNEQSQGHTVTIENV